METRDISNGGAGLAMRGDLRSIGSLRFSRRTAGTAAYQALGGFLRIVIFLSTTLK